MPVHSFTVASNTGDAIGMAEEIGAALDLEHVKIPSSGRSITPSTTGWSAWSTLPGWPWSIWTAADLSTRGAPPEPGNPFSPLEHQPQKIAYAIFDSDTVEQMGQELLERTSRDDSLHRCMLNWRGELEYECAELDIAAHKADTLEELAKKV